MSAWYGQGAATRPETGVSEPGAGQPMESGVMEAAIDSDTANGRLVAAGGHEWRIRELGRGPEALLLHGTGSSAHSWRGLSAILARRFRLLMPDLPGHGRTVSPPHLKLGLPAMCEAVGGLLGRLRFRPKLVIGHSAGAAILARNGSRWPDRAGGPGQH